MTGAAMASAGERLPVNAAPYTMILYEDPSGRRVRSRIVPELAAVRFEQSAPIRRFPAYPGRRSHQGRYWLSRSGAHVQFESRFEMTALMVLDFEGQAVAVSSNPFWLLWPRGSDPQRHAPDFFIRRTDGSVLVMDVKPASRLTDNDRIQHARTRAVCGELSWEYREFTNIASPLERNLRLLCGYHHRRFGPSAAIRDAVLGELRSSDVEAMRLDTLINTACARTGLHDGVILCGVYHMLWCGELQVDLNYPLTWDTTVRA
ncbi:MULTISPECIES: TnsA-like heteromeric transposase endonuclease subunit [unclassified Mycobacterium]|uniref:TnsA-like heteromeric transposase endonuclease subunit n=1 Tax=unclassified Mycobacterium TaxID=2642494 RepID=UPI0029C5FD30|nr:MULTISPECIES: TnsA-like heteromeric transposase endonuclease subunit [unclassified Mycobacterium]